MTKEEIRATYSIPEILSKYRIQVRNGRCRAICHEGQHYTAKVSDNLYYCFKCNKSMDIFDIMMQFNHCDFKTAYELLGGGSKPSFRAMITAKRVTAEQKNRILKQNELKKQQKIVLAELQTYRELTRKTLPFSDQWCEGMNKIPYLEYRYDCLMEEYVKL